MLQKLKASSQRLKQLEYGPSSSPRGYETNEINEETPLSRQAAQDRLLSRLRKGARFLMDAHATLLETGERYTMLEARFLAGIDLWDHLDYMLRFVYGYKGCVLGQGQVCPGDGPVRCRSCARMVVTETGEQGVNDAPTDLRRPNSHCDGETGLELNCTASASAGNARGGACQGVPCLGSTPLGPG